MSALKEARHYAESAARASARGDEHDHVHRLTACAIALGLVAVGEQLQRIAYQNTDAQR